MPANLVNLDNLQRPLELRQGRRCYTSQGNSRDVKAISLNDAKKATQRPFSCNLFGFSFFFFHEVMYGDSIFPWRSCLRSRFNAGVNDPQKQWKDDCDRAMSSSRQLVEHHHGEADQQWPFMAYAPKLKIGNMDLSALYTCKMLFRNFCVCLYGNLTSERFGVTPPVLEVHAALP